MYATKRHSMIEKWKERSIYDWKYAKRIWENFKQIKNNNGEWKSIQTVVQFTKNASTRKSFGLWIPKLFDYNSH
jgi:hypothetical protein